MAAGVKHDYHLVNPSPWPLIGSISATALALGLVNWMKGLPHLPAHSPMLFAAGMAGVLFTMIVWWRDVVMEANQGDHTPVVSIGLRYGMILFIASEVMFFVAWFWIFFEMALFHGHRAGLASAIPEVQQEDHSGSGSSDRGGGGRGHDGSDSTDDSSGSGGGSGSDGRSGPDDVLPRD